MFVLFVDYIVPSTSTINKKFHLQFFDPLKNSKITRKITKKFKFVNIKIPKKQKKTKLPQKINQPLPKTYLSCSAWEAE
jgi:hypothetical protein